MADYYHVVCSMCGDVGFPEKLFCCSNGCNRFQHSYCSNYYSEAAEPIEVCDWCRREEKSNPRKEEGCSRKSAVEPPYSGGRRMMCSSERRKTNNNSRVATTSTTSSHRTTTRRYKLLKDIMC